MQTAPELDSEQPTTTKRCAFKNGHHGKCQFESRDSDLIEFGGRHWCYFHLPERDAEGVTSAKASWDLLTREAFNEAVFKIIEGARSEHRCADFSGVVFPYPISFKRFSVDHALPEIRFAQAQFLAVVDFDHVHFGGTVDLSDSSFHAVATFHHATFQHSADFSRTNFYQDIWFKHAHFRGPLNFTAAVFHLDAGFTESRFGDHTVFNEAVFTHYAGFNNVLVAGDAWFDNIKFRSFAGFVESRFQSDASFANSIFSGNCALSKAVFDKNATFADVVFNREARFEQAQFAGITRFERAVFYADGLFNTARFNRDARFTNTVFRGSAQFNRAKFVRDAGFSDARFERDLQFERGIFHGHAGFIGADIGRANFKEAKFRSDALFFCSPNYQQHSADEDDYDEEAPPTFSFQSALFGARAMFANRKFIYPAVFENAEFTIAPDFYGSDLPKGTTFNRCRFLDRGAGNERAAWAYHTLKLLLEANGDRASAAMFFTYEQEAMSNTHQNWTILRLLPKLYEITTCNGQSISRPLLWLVATTVTAFCLYIYLLTEAPVSGIWSTDRESLAEIAKLTLMPVVVPFWAVSAECEYCGRGVKVLMSLQSVLSLTWIVLSLMAVRRRFQRGDAASKKESFDEVSGV